MKNWLKLLTGKSAAPHWWQGGAYLKVLDIHAVAYSEKYATSPDLTAPMQQVQELVHKAHASGHSFVSLAELLHGDLPADRPCILVTFDDAYACIQDAVTWLTAHGVPCAIYACSLHSATGRGYWWDTLRQERLTRGATEAEIQRETKQLKTFSPQQIDDYLAKAFSAACVDQQREATRALLPQEISAMVKHPLVAFGNHTHRHAILTNLNEAQMIEELTECQRGLQEWTGTAPTTLVYPNGFHDQRVRDVTERLGFKAAFTTRPGLLPLPLRMKADERLRIGRWLEEPFAGLSAD